MENKITVIDSIMGSGKTSWAVEFINSNLAQNVLYITPFLKETERIVSATNREIKLPVNKGNGKIGDINNLLACQEDIASTHELFRRLTDESKEAIRNGHYTLILDETINAIEPYEPKKKDNIKYLKDKGSIYVDEEDFIVWNDEDYSTEFDEIKVMAKNRSLFYVNDKLLMWRYPPEIFKLFDKVYILTYLFNGSILKSYFDLHKIQYERKSIYQNEGKYILCDYYKADTSKYSKLINIYDGNLNSSFTPKIQKESALSVSWFKASSNKEKIKALKNNVYNYFHNICNAKSETILWTTFKNVKSALSGNGYTKKFIPCNCRSTNDYKGASNLAYCINVFMHPGISQFFYQKGIDIDQEEYALAEMLQWIWRSRIREGKSINIYIPSNRMRRLLQKWIGIEYK